MAMIDQYFSLTRPIDLDYPTNRAIVIATGVVSVVALVVSLIGGTPVFESIFTAARSGLSVFFAWALAREIDPDHEMSAFFAAGIVVAGLTASIIPNVIVAVWLLAHLRIVNRISGIALTPLDAAGSVALTAWVAFDVGWLFAILGMSAFLLNGVLPPQHVTSRVYAILALVIGLLVFSMKPGEGRESIGILEFIVLVVLFSCTVVLSKTTAAVADRTGERVNPLRVQATQILAFSTALLAAIWFGEESVRTLFGLWSASLAAVVFILFSWVRKLAVRS